MSLHLPKSTEIRSVDSRACGTERQMPRNSNSITLKPKRLPHIKSSAILQDKLDYPPYVRVTSEFETVGDFLSMMREQSVRHDKYEPSLHTQYRKKLYEGVIDPHAKVDRSDYKMYINEYLRKRGNLRRRALKIQDNHVHLSKICCLRDCEPPKTDEQLRFELKLAEMKRYPWTLIEKHQAKNTKQDRVSKTDEHGYQSVQRRGEEPGLKLDHETQLKVDTLVDDNIQKKFQSKGQSFESTMKQIEALRQQGYEVDIPY